jgi:AcrR family transcriptional regulator
VVVHLPKGVGNIKTYLSRKQSIVVSALEIIDELGIEALSIRELAKRQGIVEGALYKHFNSKDEILHAILDYYSRYDLNIKNTIQNNGLTYKESIIFFIKSYAEIYESNPAMTCIGSSYEVLMNGSSVVNRVKEIFSSRSDYLTYLVKQGQLEGSIGCSLSAEDLSDTILGLFRTVTLKWRMSNYSFPLKSRVISALEIILLKF